MLALTVLAGVFLACSSGGPPAPTAVPLTLPELKYELLDEFPSFFWCDPDHYPISRPGEEEAAARTYSDIRADTVEYATIIDRLGLRPDSLTDEQKLSIYREHKKLRAIQVEPREGGFRFDIATAADGTGTRIVGDISSSGDIEVAERSETIATCPICLVTGTRIATPLGEVPVEQLVAGDLVWTTSDAGQRQAAPVLRTARSLVGHGHRAVEVGLADGRTVTASAGHPTADGRTFGRLEKGDPLDGSTIVSVRQVPLPGAATFDILPEGATGAYWANGVLIKSSIMGSRR